MSTCGIAVGQAELRFWTNNVRLIFVECKLIWKIAPCSTSTKRNPSFSLEEKCYYQKKRAIFFLKWKVDVAKRTWQPTCRHVGLHVNM